MEKSPVLILGDRCISSKSINAAKKKYSDCLWLEFSLKDSDIDEIRSQSCTLDILGREKIILLKEIPNKKAIREFILDLVSCNYDKVGFVVWDSDGVFSYDDKTKQYKSTWKDFIDEFKKNKNHKIVDNGHDFLPKDWSCIDYIIECFQKYGIEITRKDTELFKYIVGENRGNISSEVSKLAITSPKKIDREFILNNTFPSATEVVFYELDDVLTENSVDRPIEMMQRFLDLGVNENVMAEILAKKARWRLAAVSLWCDCGDWGEVSSKLMEMGKFPSEVWHSDMSSGKKKSMSEEYSELDKRREFVANGLPIRYFNLDNDDKTRGEYIPMPFMASKLVESICAKFVAPNKHIEREELKKKLLDKVLNTYIVVIEGLKQVRYGDNPRQDLMDMVLSLVDSRI